MSVFVANFSKRRTHENWRVLLLPCPRHMTAALQSRPHPGERASAQTGAGCHQPRSAKRSWVVPSVKELSLDWAATSLGVKVNHEAVRRPVRVDSAHVVHGH